MKTADERKQTGDTFRTEASEIIAKIHRENIATAGKQQPVTVQQQKQGEKNGNRKND